MSKSRSPRADRNGLDLMMVCEDEELSESQIAAHDEAEREYQEAIQKINVFKSGNAQIIQGSTVSSSQPGLQAGQLAKRVVSVALPQGQQPPIQMQQLQSLIGSPKVAAPLGTQPQQFIIQNQVPLQQVGGSAVSSYKLLVDTRTGMILGTVPGDQAVLTTTPSVSQNTLSQLQNLYGQPRRTSNKSHAVKLFEKGKDLKEIAVCMKISESAAEVYLIDSLFLGEDIEYVRLSQLLNISGEMMSRILEMLTWRSEISLLELQHEMMYSFNQLRLCIARLFRNLTWKPAEDDFLKERE